MKFGTSRSGGKGGQHVNKTETKVTLVFDVRDSNFLTFNQKERIERSISSRINSGVLRINSEATRSQVRNKSEAISRFFSILENALKKPVKRIPTKIPKSKKEGRLRAKKKTQEKKELRKKIRKQDY